MEGRFKAGDVIRIGTFAKGVVNFPSSSSSPSRSESRKNSTLIAEAWDAAGLYQVGTFPNFGRWAEWNGQFRDDLRRFVRGDAGMVPTLATRSYNFV